MIKNKDIEFAKLVEEYEEFLYKAVDHVAGCTDMNNILKDHKKDAYKRAVNIIAEINKKALTRKANMIRNHLKKPAPMDLAGLEAYLDLENLMINYTATDPEYWARKSGSELDENVIRHHAYYLDWSIVSMHHELPEEIIEKYFHRLDLLQVSYNSPKNFEKYLIRNYKTIDWPYLSKRIYINKRFISKFANCIEWLAAASDATLDDDAKAYALDLNYYIAQYICKCQILSEDFIQKHLKQLCWSEVCQYQKLSEDFILDHKQYIDWLALNLNTKPAVSKEFLDKYTPDKIKSNIAKAKKELTERTKDAGKNNAKF